jgi:hypothetical protein
MRRITIAVVAAGALAGLASYLPLAFGQVEQETSPIYGIKIPKGYRNWPLISVTLGRSRTRVRAHICCSA